MKNKICNLERVSLTYEPYRDITAGKPFENHTRVLPEYGRRQGGKTGHLPPLEFQSNLFPKRYLLRANLI